jgi:hypothetical protein
MVVDMVFCRWRKWESTEEGVASAAAAWRGALAILGLVGWVAPTGSNAKNCTSHKCSLGEVWEGMVVGAMVLVLVLAVRGYACGGCGGVCQRLSESRCRPQHRQAHLPTRTHANWITHIYTVSFLRYRTGSFFWMSIN